MFDANLGPLVTGVLLVIFGPIAIKVLERVMGNAPTWVWRLLAFLCVVAGWAIVLLNDPVKTQVKLHPKAFVFVTILVLIAAALVVRTRWFDATPATDATKRDYLIARLRDFISEANLMDRGHPLYPAHFRYGVGGRIEQFLSLYSTEWVTRFKQAEVFAVEEILAEIVDGAPIPTLGAPEARRPTQLLSPTTPSIDPRADRLWVTVRGQNIRLETKYFEREQGYSFDKSVTGSPLTLFLKQGRVEVDTEIYSKSGVLPIDRNRLIIRPPRWDSNCNENALEIVNERQLPVFQMIVERPTHLTIKGQFSENDATDQMVRIFRYPSYDYAGEHELNALNEQR
jgi:hypothetical protein